MAPDSLRDMIAERRLTLVSDAGEPRDILVRIGKPERIADQHFGCECQIVGVGDGRVRRIYGLDAFHSLQLTLGFVSYMLNHHRQEAQGRIYWQEPADDMGFVYVEPTPTSGT